MAIRQGAHGLPEVVVLGFIPADERRLRFNFVFPLALTMIRVAERHGGRVYGTGMFFGKSAGRVLGSERLDRLVRFKHWVDPAGIMNPGKVTGDGRMARLMGLAGWVEPLLRGVGNRIPAAADGRARADGSAGVGDGAAKAGDGAPRWGDGVQGSGASRRGIPADVAYWAYACAQCGYCIDGCTQFAPRGWESQSPRGKWWWLREYLEGREDWSQSMVDTFMVCTTCERCDLLCSEGLPIQESWMQLRGELIQRENRMTLPAFEVMGAALETQGDIWAGFRRDRGAWFPGDLEASHGPGHRAKAVYFAGCTGCYVEQDIAIASTRLLDVAGVDFTFLGEKESCCGTPMLVAGKWELFAETMKRNVQAVKDAGADTVISSCPACDMMWRKVYPEWCEKLGIDYGITARHYSEVISEKVRAGEFSFPAGRGELPSRVTFHDSCHIGRASGVFDPPREVIRAIPGVELVEMEHNREDALCCGSVLTLIKDPPVAAEMGKTRLEEAIAAGSETLVSLCPCCQFQFRVAADAKQIPVNVVDLAHFASQALGFELPDPKPEVQAQWAVFERMIALMTPEGFAGLMASMWPEIVDAMPLGMGGMMRAMGHVPGALEAMRPLFPVLFPRLLPRMMPALMPTMIDRIQQRIPMPDYMKQQLPTLLSRAMANLMPHMLPDVVPLVAQPLVDYLKAGAA
jgi:Fe-S oxidoreductase